MKEEWRVGQGKQMFSKSDSNGEAKASLKRVDKTLMCNTNPVASSARNRSQPPEANPCVGPVLISAILLAAKTFSDMSPIERNKHP